MANCGACLASGLTSFTYSQARPDGSILGSRVILSADCGSIARKRCLDSQPTTTSRHWSTSIQPRMSCRLSAEKKKSKAGVVRRRSRLSKSTILTGGTSPKIGSTKRRCNSSGYNDRTQGPSSLRSSDDTFQLCPALCITLAMSAYASSHASRSSSVNPSPNSPASAPNSDSRTRS